MSDVKKTDSDKWEYTAITREAPIADLDITYNAKPEDAAEMLRKFNEGLPEMRRLIDGTADFWAKRMHEMALKVLQECCDSLPVLPARPGYRDDQAHTDHTADAAEYAMTPFMEAAQRRRRNEQKAWDLGKHYSLDFSMRPASYVSVTAPPLRFNYSPPTPPAPIPGVSSTVLLQLCDISGTTLMTGKGRTRLPMKPKPGVAYLIDLDVTNHMRDGVLHHFTVIDGTRGMVASVPASQPGVMDTTCSLDRTYIGAHLHALHVRDEYLVCPARTAEPPPKEVVSLALNVSKGNGCECGTWRSGGVHSDYCKFAGQSCAPFEG